MKIVTIFTSQVFLISSIQKSQLLLPPANVVCEDYDFTPVCDSVNGEACMVAPGGDVRGCSGGVCCGCSGGWGACVVARGACVVFPRGGMRRIRRDTVNEWAVRILLECILVLSYVTNSCCLYIAHINISDPEIAPIST